MAITRRFATFFPISAKYAQVGSCGHHIKGGDRIGYSRPTNRFGGIETCCARCWAKWEDENAEAARLENCGGTSHVRNT